MSKLSGKRDVVIKTLLTQEVADDLQALATLNRSTVGHITCDLICKYLYGRIGIANMDDDRTEIQGPTHGQR